MTCPDDDQENPRVGGGREVRQTDRLPFHLALSSRRET